MKGNIKEVLDILQFPFSRPALLQHGCKCLMACISPFPYPPGGLQTVKGSSSVCFRLLNTQHQLAGKLIKPLRQK
jgi:hypothetical protein